MKQFIKPALTITAIVMIVAGVNQSAQHQQKIELQSVEIKSRTTELKDLQSKFDKLNNDYKNTDVTNKTKIDELNKEKESLNNQKAELEKQLQAKLQAKTLAASKLNNASKSASVSTQTASAAPVPTGSVQDMVTAAANKYGVSPTLLHRIAKCESGYNPSAVNNGYTAGGGHPSGVFQFIPSTWTRMSNQAGYGGSSVFDAYSNVNVAAWAFANGRAGEWECR